MNGQQNQINIVPSTAFDLDVLLAMQTPVEGHFSADTPSDIYRVLGQPVPARFSSNIKSEVPAYLIDVLKRSEHMQQWKFPRSCQDRTLEVLKADATCVPLNQLSMDFYAFNAQIAELAGGLAGVEIAQTMLASFRKRFPKLLSLAIHMGSKSKETERMDRFEVRMVKQGAAESAAFKEWRYGNQNENRRGMKRKFQVFNNT
ncbi:hypothetical protein L596_010476 [Steinernema carpocapsae]|nr:hypothetical protein L596_010476 [Steinernema carpocapsae]